MRFATINLYQNQSSVCRPTKLVIWKKYWHWDGFHAHLRSTVLPRHFPEKNLVLFPKMEDFGGKEALNLEEVRPFAWLWNWAKVKIMFFITSAFYFY